VKRISHQAFEAELDKILEGLRRYGPDRVILFGSFARGDYHAASDVDLLIVKDTHQPFVERSADVWRMCPSELAIEPLVYTPAEFARMVQQGNPLVSTALREGIVIYEQ